MMPNGIARFVKDTSGVTAIEYGLIAAIVVVGILASVGVLGDNVTASYDKTAESFAELP